MGGPTPYVLLTAWGAPWGSILEVNGAGRLGYGGGFARVCACFRCALLVLWARFGARSCLPSDLFPMAFGVVSGRSWLARRLRLVPLARVLACLRAGLLLVSFAFQPSFACLHELY